MKGNLADVEVLLAIIAIAQVGSCGYLWFG